MKAELRISIKDYRRNKNLKIQLAQVPLARRASLCADEWRTVAKGWRPSFPGIGLQGFAPRR